MFNLTSYSNNKDIISNLRKIGKIAKDFDYFPLLSLVEHEDSKIRVLAVKNLAKLKNLDLLSRFESIAKTDASFKVKIESVSAIGRMRHQQIIDVLLNFLKNDNPEIVLQAIRGLLSFKELDKISSILLTFKKHPNEIIRYVIDKEFPDKTKEKKEGSHTNFPKYLKNVAVQGDTLNIMKMIPKNSIHLTFTSPPYYNARDYSIYKSYKEYLSFLKKTFKDVYRITKTGRFLVVNTSPIIIPRVGRKYASKRYPIPYDLHNIIQDLGWEFVDDIIWLKPEPSVKNRNAGFLQHRKPLGYKPNAITEMVMVYRKKSNRLLDWNIKQYDNDIVEKSKILGKYETSNVWRIDPAFDKTHTAIFPLELCNRIIKFYSYKNDLVFDPFAGSGTLAKSALNLNRNFFISEINQLYFDRIKENLNDKGLFSKGVNFYKEIEFKKIIKQKEKK